MAENTYSVGYSTNARAKCKYSGCDEKDIQKDELRFSKSAATANGKAPKFEYFHAKCMFLSFVRARKATKKIESMSDMEGVDSLKSGDKELIKKLLKEWKSGSMKDQVPKINRKRKADGDNDATDDKKKKKKTNESSKGKKTSRKTDSDDEEDDYKPKKSRFIKDDDEEEEEELKPSKKTTASSSKKPTKEESEEDDSDEDDEKFNQILKGGKGGKGGKGLYTSSKKAIDLDDSEEEEEEKKPAAAPPKKSGGKKKSSDESASEEVKESESSAEEKESEEENSDKFLSGKIISVIGKLSMPREKIIALIEKNGGKYAKSITKDVTHVIVAKKDDKTKSLQKAKEDGKIIVTESFLKRGQ